MTAEPDIIDFYVVGPRPAEERRSTKNIGDLIIMFATGALVLSALVLPLYDTLDAPRLTTQVQVEGKNTGTELTGGAFTKYGRIGAHNVPTYEVKVHGRIDGRDYVENVRVSSDVYKRLEGGDEAELTYLKPRIAPRIIVEKLIPRPTLGAAVTAFFPKTQPPTTSATPGSASTRKLGR